MFKRVEKRRRKREEEEELGLDEDMKEVLGMHDTDSEESASDSDDSSDGAEGSDEQEHGSETGAFEDEDLDDVEDESEAEEEQPVITVQEALRDPVYLVSLEPTVKACIVCPGKLLKGAKMVELHRTSNACTAHERRVKLFGTLASRAKPKDNAWDLLRQYAEKKRTPSLAAPSETSKRAQKRKAHAAFRKTRRDKHKAKAKAKKIAVEPSVQETNTPQPAKPPKKKQKVATTSRELASPPQPPPETASATIKSIARSASDRAKVARARVAKPKPKRIAK